MAFPVVLSTFLFSIFGVFFIIARRVPDIAFLPRPEKTYWINFFRKYAAIPLKFLFRIFNLFRIVGFWIARLSAEKFLAYLKITALRLENFSSRRLEQIRASKGEFPKFSFFEDFAKKDVDATTVDEKKTEMPR